MTGVLNTSNQRLDDANPALDIFNQQQTTI